MNFGTKHKNSLSYLRQISLIKYRSYATATFQNQSNKEKRRLQKKLDVEKQQKQQEPQLVDKSFSKFTDVEYVGSNKLGDKKDISQPLPKMYSSTFFESDWYEWWEKEGLFQPRHGNESFSMVIPPPNVTGDLHLGHALTCAIEDTIVRWQRMRGKEVLWLPGCDHAGIATQIVVERKLAESKGVNVEDLKPEEVQKAIWHWKGRKGNNIFRQLKRLGASLDWEKSTFTLDPQYTAAVTHAFIRLHNEGLIYRDTRMVNWCCHLNTSLSDLEVESKILHDPISMRVCNEREYTQFGILFNVAYKLVEPVGNIHELVISTTRLETILGDEAIAVNPNDPRYSNLIGQFVQHPLLPHKKLPVIADEAVDIEFGTGALKVSPMHDYVDFEIAKRHDLPLTRCISHDGLIAVQRDSRNSKFVKRLDNVCRFRARELIDQYLMDIDQFRGCSPHKMILRLCQRSGDVIEPMSTTQWFLRTSELAKAAKEAVDNGEVEMQSRYYNEWNNWIVNQQDWCISRQINWGHPIPAYKCTNKITGKSVWVSQPTKLEIEEKAMSELDAEAQDIRFKKSPDVLDTWFSSALFPFAALGWPNETDDFKKFYPLNIMETGHDLIFFWVARMIMMGITLTGQVPFKKVLFHPMVCDKYGRKMSKSVGNVIDPITIVDGLTVDGVVKSPKCGSDALRLSLLQKSLDNNKITLSEKDALTNRIFLNKIYKIFELVGLIAEDQSYALNKMNEENFDHKQYKKNLCNMSLWIRSRYAITVDSVNEALDNNNFSRAFMLLQQFFVNDYGNTYLQIRLKIPYHIDPQKSKYCIGSDENMDFQLTCVEILESFLRLISPFAPYISEELWQRLPWDLLPHISRPKSVMIAEYPQCLNKDEINEQLNKEIDLVGYAVNKSLSAALHYQLLHRDIKITFLCKNNESRDILKKHHNVLKILIHNNAIEVATIDDISQHKLDHSIKFKLCEHESILLEFENPASFIREKKQAIEKTYYEKIDSIKNIENKRKPGNWKSFSTKISKKAESAIKYEEILDLIKKYENK